MNRWLLIRRMRGPAFRLLCGVTALLHEPLPELVTEEMVAESVVCGPDLDRHVAHLEQFARAGVDEVFVQQIGGDHAAFFDATGNLQHGADLVDAVSGD